MPGQLLNTQSQIQCPHGGKAQLLTSNARIQVDGGYVLLESDIHPIVGCTFTIGPKYSPCVRIEWSAGAQKQVIQGTAVLVQSSMGKCLSAEGATQGMAIIANTQMKGSGQ